MNYHLLNLQESIKRLDANLMHLQVIIFELNEFLL